MNSEKISAQCMKNLSLHFAKWKLNENGEKIASESWRKKSVGIWRVGMQND
jgi:hypothetical protein